MTEYLHTDPNDIGVTKPVIYWRGQIIFLTRTQDGPIRFGGSLPKITNQGPAILHSLLTIPTTELRTFGVWNAEILPLVFPFRHDGGSIDYRITPSGCIVDLKVRPQLPEEGWPYNNYPDAFDQVCFKCSEPQAISEDDIARLVWQDPCHNPDEDILVVIPSKYEDPTLPNNFWNEDEDEPCVQCVFVINKESMKVTAFSDID